MARGPQGLNVIVEGMARARADHVSVDGGMMKAALTLFPEQTQQGVEVDAYVRRVQELVDRALTLTSGLAPEVRQLVAGIDDPMRLAYLLGTMLDLKAEEKLQLLAADPLLKKLELVHSLLTREVSVLELKGKIESQAQQEMSDAQKQYYLRQQLKAIQEELGEGEGNETRELKARIAEAKLPAHVQMVADREVDRLGRMGPASPEYQMIRTYLDWLLELPWTTVTDDRLDPIEARRVLDEDHYDLDRVKERIVEYLAVRKLKGDMKGPILCFVGPPGVGKTSLGQSIARAMQRKFVRISLGGVRDEAEIRGHRRTYIGSMPGRVIQALKQAGSANPVFMLDELDKVTVGYQGDPAAALLEVLDPAQNNTFRDHYLEVPFDLSRVLFIATANQIGPVHPALRDRMELVALSGYTEEEKLNIALKYLVPRQLTEHGLAPGAVTFTPEALRLIIGEHTREAGVRNLERQIGTIARKIAARVATGTAALDAEVEPDEIEGYLGPARFKRETSFRTSRPGVATGVAWTETGGDVLYIEASLLPGGRGQFILTGQLGEVMQESARAAVSHIRANARELGIEPNFLENRDLHVHVPAGAIPKDGPSAGVTLATAILSAIRQEPVRDDVAMTGEITLTGLVLPVGGIREKALAARRLGIKTFVLPALNEPDLKELPEEIRKDMTFAPVSTLEEVLKIALPLRPGAPADPSPPPGLGDAVEGQLPVSS
jgi:ATP-dependent Lon protease